MPKSSCALLSSSALAQIWIHINGEQQVIDDFLRSMPEATWTSLRPALDELEKIDDAASDFFGGAYQDFFNYPDQETQEKLKYILKEFPDFVDPDDFSHQSDSFLISHAIAHGNTVYFSASHLKSPLLSPSFHKIIKKEKIIIAKIDELLS